MTTGITAINPADTSRQQQQKALASKSLTPVSVVTGAKKGLNNVGEVAKGTAVGLAQGAVAGTASFLPLWALDVLKNVKNSEAPTSMMKDFIQPVAQSDGKFFGAVPKGTKKLFTQSFGKTLKNVFVDTPVKIAKTLKNTERISKPAKVVVGLISAAVVAGNIIKGKLSANEMNAGIDHRWQVGHDRK